MKMRTIVLATVAGLLLAWNVVAHADWRKTTMTAVDYAQYDIKQLHTKRPNEPPPTQSGKLEGGIKIEHEPGSIVYRIDMYPNYVARVQLEKWYKDILVPKPEIADILPVPVCKGPPLIGDKTPANDTTGQAVQNKDGCNAIIIQANTPGNPNGEKTGDGGNGTQAPFPSGYGGTVAGTGGSAVATGSMTNILALDSDGQVVANLMINTMPSWQRPDEGKVEIHNGSKLADFVNYQCAPTCRRVRDPSGRSQSNSVSGGGQGITIMYSNSNVPRSPAPSPAP
jgi:hypothetical protein